MIIHIQKRKERERERGRERERERERDWNYCIVNWLLIFQANRIEGLRLNFQHHFSL